MSIRDIVRAMNRYLPVPPAGHEIEGSEAWYLWRATQENLSHHPPLKYVQVMPPPPRCVLPNDTSQKAMTIRLTTVECDEQSGRALRIVD